MHLTGAGNRRSIKDIIHYKYIIIIYIHYICFIIYLTLIGIIIDYSFNHSKIQEHINYILLCISLYILYVVIKDKYDFIKTTFLFENQIILSKKNFQFSKKIFIEKMDTNIEKKMLL